MLKGLWRGISDFIYPPVCLLCQKGLADAPFHACLCSFCTQTIELNHPPFCGKCSANLSDAGQTVCSRCRRQELYFDRAWSICLYNEAVRRLIHLFKYGQKIGLRREFSRLILDFTQAYRIDLSVYDYVVPIPLHSARLRERGYNQAHLLAEAIARQTAAPLNTGLRRIRHTPYQASRSQKERWTNISDAFKIKHPLQFSKRRVLLVDDLMTTGATVSEAARLLKEAGAARVDVLTLASAS